MSERTEALQNRLDDARDYLNSVLDRVNGRWDTQVYSDGAQWTVVQLVRHLAISDAGQWGMAKNIIEGGEGVPADFDLERYNRRSVEKRAEMTVQEARQQLAETRGDLVLWLDTLDDDSLNREGRHGSMKIMTVEQILITMADHEQNHADDIARVLGIEG